MCVCGNIEGFFAGIFPQIKTGYGQDGIPDQIESLPPSLFLKIKFLPEKRLQTHSESLYTPIFESQTADNWDKVLDVDNFVDQIFQFYYRSIRKWMHDGGIEQISCQIAGKFSILL